MPLWEYGMRWIMWTIDHQLLACRAALAQQFMVSKLNETFANSDLPLITARMGIQTDYVLAGNIGSPLGMKYGLVGDDLNLASRFEGLNRDYGTRVIVSEHTLVDSQESCRSAWSPRNPGESGSLFLDSDGNLARESTLRWSTANGAAHEPHNGIRVLPRRAPSLSKGK
ncbi:hypothetical protein BJ742DRAFT_548238 [Cladochytrium replicatum]|nr:hypothetical protein BJ742DRAFT_548238 [Cladochytrium replicatum]